ncbi:hypothetical protein INT43_006788 [Umbelopsis isabellina]|uniref:DUF7905 domain-containing protein n=1 Tax=Mortierella isabellina TaxID=91625 RepID=A0A8H7Q0E0_MORIS|nr:hypothetical protein INT43_006788 [Umbelopsis isabellina]
MANLTRLIETSGSNTIDIDGIGKTYPELRPLASGPNATNIALPAPKMTHDLISDNSSSTESANLQPANGHNKIKEDNEDIQEEEKQKHRTFVFAKNVRNVQSVLAPSHYFVNNSTEYLQQIEKDTHTTCVLENRSIEIVGSRDEDLDDAEHRFRICQAVYKRSKKYDFCQPVPVTHYPTNFEHFGIVFCHLPQYAHADKVDVHPNETKPIQMFFVLVPTFKDENGKFIRPKLIKNSPSTYRQPSNSPSPVASTPSSPMISRSTDLTRKLFTPPLSSESEGSGPESERSQSRISVSNKNRPQTSDEKKPKLEALNKTNENMQEMKPTVAWNKVAILSAVVPLIPNSQPLDGPVLWGEGRTWTTSSSNAFPTANSRPQQGRTASIGVEDFPCLQPASKSKDTTASISSSKSKKNTVNDLERKMVTLRMTKAPADVLAPGPVLSPVEALREYNFHTIYSTLEPAFEDARTFKGDLRFSARLGKVLWTDVKPEIQQKVWEYTDLRDIVQNQYGAVPHFNNVLTTKEAVINNISDVLPAPFKRSAYYEIVTSARNQPHYPYSEVTLKINSNVVDLEKVTTNHQNMAEITWTSLDRKFDFAFNLTKKDTLRTDIKPFTTFIRKCSVSLKSRSITFQNIPDFLDVKQVLLKHTQYFRLHYPFVVEITRVELLPLQQQSSTGTIVGHAGNGDVWFEFELVNNEHNEKFKQNRKLPVGTVASWTVDDMLGTEEAGAKLVEIVKCMLLLVEQADPVC